MIHAIKTDRLEIKMLSHQDHDEIAELFLDENVKKTYMIPDFPTREDLDKLVWRMIELSLAESRFVRGIYFKDKLIGIVNDVEIREHCIELGYAIHPKHWNKGYCTEMLKAVTQGLLNDTFSVVKTGAFEKNLASIRVMEKCGMRRTEESDMVEYRGVNHNCVYYEITQ